MTSQKWLDETQVDKSIWWHMVGIIIPDEINDLERAWVFTEGGSNSESTTPPDYHDISNILGATISSNVGMIGGYVMQNPNTPIVFADDPSQRRRGEDALYAWTWRSYLNNPNPDPEVIIRMPMTKTHKRGLDIIAEVAKEKIPETNIDKFIVTGASKRGWTALSLAAVDPRVEMCLNIVFTVLNIKEVQCQTPCLEIEMSFSQTLIRHQQALDGGWSWALEPFFDEDIFKDLKNPKMEEVFEVEDVLHYKERLTIPKIFILATGDEFCMPQDLDTYWDDLPDPKYIMCVHCIIKGIHIPIPYIYSRMNPNAQHSAFPHYVRIMETMQGAMLSLMRDEAIPSVSWRKGTSETGGFIEAWMDPAPEEIRCSRAETVNTTRRDFRLLQGYPDLTLQPVWWNWTDVQEVASGHYLYEEENLEDGRWTGFFMQGRWTGPDENRMYLTTALQITPDDFPGEPCFDEDSCSGELV
ncbi:hypothetical protein CAPTEDRAFT_193693 [Capitella teleta]|uniref:Uncharacterized protein n=1 Tax=Capitella teleta TaxID=283909 RepID=R7TF80_CAPTE|nr:hypothetical protein CAPTEDRAFT_193693 [Capitella teleta]|eukprot:ELT89701.1 hypothetical protein CAPTEDRAFT_193693 [Capitella teleta]